MSTSTSSDLCDIGSLSPAKFSVGHFGPSIPSRNSFKSKGWNDWMHWTLWTRGSIPICLPCSLPGRTTATSTSGPSAAFRMGGPNLGTGCGGAVFAGSCGACFVLLGTLGLRLLPPGRPVVDALSPWLGGETGISITTSMSLAGSGPASVALVSVSTSIFLQLGLPALSVAISKLMQFGLPELSGAGG